MYGDIQGIFDHHMVINRQIAWKKLKVKILASFFYQPSFEVINRILGKCMITVHPLKLLDPRFQAFVVFPDLLHISLNANILHGESELGLQFPTFLQIKHADEKLIARQLNTGLNFHGALFLSCIGGFVKLIGRREKIYIILLDKSSIAHNESKRLTNLIPLVTNSYFLASREVNGEHDVLQRAHRVGQIKRKLLPLN